MAVLYTVSAKVTITEHLIIWMEIGPYNLLKHIALTLIYIDKFHNLQSLSPTWLSNTNRGPDFKLCSVMASSSQLGTRSNIS